VILQNANLSGFAAANRPADERHPVTKEMPMLYAILAYHVETEVMSWTPEEDAAVMTNLHEVHGRLNQRGSLGPAARLGPTQRARTLRGPGKGTVLDGPFAENQSS
jgi:hypothetical protein